MEFLRWQRGSAAGSAKPGTAQSAAQGQVETMAPSSPAPSELGAAARYTCRQGQWRCPHVLTQDSEVALSVSHPCTKGSSRREGQGAGDRDIACQVPSQ